MADLPLLRLSPHTPLFYNTARDYFGPYNVKIGRNKNTEHHGVRAGGGLLHNGFYAGTSQILLYQRLPSGDDER